MVGLFIGQEDSRKRRRKRRKEFTRKEKNFCDKFATVDVVGVPGNKYVECFDTVPVIKRDKHNFGIHN